MYSNVVEIMKWITTIFESKLMILKFKHNHQSAEVIKLNHFEKKRKTEKKSFYVASFCFYILLLLCVSINPQKKASIKNYINHKKNRLVYCNISNDNEDNENMELKWFDVCDFHQSELSTTHTHMIILALFISSMCLSLSILYCIIHLLNCNVE